MDYSNYNARKDGKYEKIWQSTGKCVFCDLKDKYIIKETEKAVLTVNLFPYIDGHLLVIPKRHVELFSKIEKEEWEDIKNLADTGIRLLREVLGIEEVWVVHRAPGGHKANKTVAHTHMLLTPYKKGLVDWHYQEITISPLDLANKLRDNL